MKLIEEESDTEKPQLSEETTKQLPPLSEQMSDLEPLWDTLSQCLFELEHTPDDHAVLVLQPAVEAFFLIHSPNNSGPPSQTASNQASDSHSQSIPISDMANIQILSPNSRSNVQEEASTWPTSDSQTASGQAVASSNIQDNSQVSNSDTSRSPTPRIQIDEDTAEVGTKSQMFMPDHGSDNSKSNMTPEQLIFINFAEKHRTVLNQILRQSTVHLSDGPFAVLVDYTKVLDFDVKRKYFRTELERRDQGLRREETAVNVRRGSIFEDSFRELYRRSTEEWKNRFYIVFEGEEGQDAGGLLREWYMIISRDIFNPMYALFTTSPGDRVTYTINTLSHYNPNHLCYYKFVGKVIAKAIYDNKLLECYFTRSFYKHILGIPVKFQDMESEDYSFYKGLEFLINHHIDEFGSDLTFSIEVNEFGVTETRDLIPNGRNITVTEENKMQYVQLSCQMKMTGAIRKQ